MEVLKLTLQLIDEETGELYGTIEDIQEFDLDRPMAQASIVYDIQDLIAIAKDRSGL